MSSDAGSLVRVNVKRLLEFLDEKAPGSIGHASAIISVCGEDLGMGLMRHYFESQGASVEIDTRALQGTLSGVRLDGWLRITSSDEDTLYQVEIKNWSAHAIHGKKLLIDVSEDELASYKKARWREQWDDATGLTQKPLFKVLTRMRPPARLDHLQVRPLACFWMALHPKGRTECFFSQELPVKTSWCSTLWVFSMSAYLRSLGEPFIDLQMPDTRARMAWLGELIVEDSDKDWGR